MLPFQVFDDAESAGLKSQDPAPQIHQVPADGSGCLKSARQQFRAYWQIPWNGPAEAERLAMCSAFGLTTSALAQPSSDIGPYSRFDLFGGYSYIYQR